LRAAPLSVLLPVGIVEAMERAFLQAPIGSPNAEEKRQGDAMTGSAKVYELRIYHVVPGKLDSLVARFRDYTDKLFAKRGMTSVAYWTALDEPVKSSTFFTFWSIRAARRRPRTGRPSRTIWNGRP
jgi:hypothetical protein